MKKVILSLSVIASLTLTSCVDASVSKFTALGSKHKVELYNGGQLIRTWISTGKPQSEVNSDGYYFTDKETGKLVEVCGAVIITQM